MEKYGIKSIKENKLHSVDIAQDQRWKTNARQKGLIVLRTKNMVKNKYNDQKH